MRQEWFVTVDPLNCQQYEPGDAPRGSLGQTTRQVVLTRRTQIRRMHDAFVYKIDVEDTSTRTGTPNAGSHTWRNAAHIPLQSGRSCCCCAVCVQCPPGVQFRLPRGRAW
jgi:hypothetical protein